MKDPEETVKCPACEREVPKWLMQAHHLKTRRKDKQVTEMICRECHSSVHGLFSNTELRDPRLELDSLEGLMANERFWKAVGFIRKVPPGVQMPAKRSKNQR